MPFKHGKIYTKKYKSWDHMKERCMNPNCKNYNDYGGRGITVCNEWLSFNNFDQDMSDPPSNKYTLHRIKNHLGYYKENCVWATAKEQGAEKRNNKKFTFNGKTQILAEWARELNIDEETINYRIYKRGWSIKKALTTPVRNINKLIDFNGQSKILGEWAKDYNIDQGTLYARIYLRNWDFQKALSTPVRKGNYK